MISFDEALDHIVAASRGVQLGAERVVLHQATGRVLAEDVRAAVASPPFDQSAMDGWAVRVEDARVGASLRIQEAVIAAGAGAPEALQPGCALRIFTGAMIPPGADAVVRQERARVEGDRAVLAEDARAGQDVRRRGEALDEGVVLARAGEVVSAGLASALAMVGVAEVSVVRPCRVRLLVTGDEVVPVGEVRRAGALFDGNTPLLVAALGADPRVALSVTRGPDEAQALGALMAEARAEAELVITTGGASVGDRDLIREASVGAGFEAVFWKVAQKPGKPLYLARHPGGALHLGLPGTPAAVAVASALHLRWALAAMLGQPLPARRVARWASEPPRADASRTRHVFARVDEGGALHSLEQLPGLLQSARADAVAVIPPGGEAPWWTRFG